jgi:geranylgeranylglycerol-phosphate geranylgeranyltransferase
MNTAYITIIRPVNCTVAGIAAIFSYFLVTGTFHLIVFLVWLMVFLITAAGNVINDYFDAEIDAINCSKRAIPSGALSTKAAYAYAIFLFALGNCIGIIPLVYGMTFPLCIALFNSVLLWAYSRYLKTTPGFGNIAVAYLSASIFLFGAAFIAPDHLGTALTYALPITGATFGVMLAREIVKDAEDVIGDREAGAKTLPILYGIKTSVRFAAVCAVFGVICSLFLYLRWGVLYLFGIIFVDIIILWGALAALSCTTPDCVQKSRASKYLKYGMFSSLVIFFFAAALL